MNLEKLSIHAWITNNSIKTETGELLDFKKYRFMFDVYADRSPLICCMKSAQIGFTTYEILKSAHECKEEKIDIIYVLPTQDDVNKFSGGKTNKMIAQNPVLQSWTKDKDSITQKQFGDNTIYYQGSWTERAALMITAKKLIVDEYDRCKPAIVEQYDSRLQSVANPKKAFFSNPSMPDFGIDKFYKLSDQKKWHITHSCGKTYIIDEKCIDYDKEMFICPLCKEEILDEERRMGKWIATAKGVWSGYWIPLWIAPWMSAKNIAQYKKEKTSEYFANFVAGLPYIAGGNKVSAQTLLKCISNVANDQEDRIIIGVDTGLPIHYVCANKQGYFYYGKCSDPTTGKDPYLELESLLIRWPTSILISDQGGDLIGIRKLQAKYPGRVFLVWYRPNRKTTDLIQWGEGNEYGKVIADRNRLFQLFIDEMSDKRVVFNGTESDWQEYITHWLNIYRTAEENSLGVKEFKWERNGPDHYCFDGDTKIKTFNGYKKIRDISVGEFVLCSDGGHRQVYKSWLTQTHAKTITAIFSNGSRIIATPNHKFKTKNRGETTLYSLSYDDKLITWKKSNIKVSNTEDIQTQKEEQIGSIIPLTAHTGLKDMLDYINKYGLITLEKFLKVLSYTIKTAIRLIIKYQIWIVFQEANIKVNTQQIDLNNLIIEQDKKNTSRQSDPYHINGGVQKQVKNGILNMLIKVSYWINQKSLCVLSVILKAIHEVVVEVSSVPQDVVIVGMHENIEKRNVYNISVSDKHEYFAEDILVSNCHASLYCRIGLDKYGSTLATIVDSGIFEDMEEGRIFDNSENMNNSWNF